MKQHLLQGLPSDRRLRGVLVVLGLVGLLLLLKAFGLLPQFLDELPQHLEESSIDNQGNDIAFTELVPIDIYLNTFFDFIRYDLGVDTVSRFISKEIKDLITVFNGTLLGGRLPFGYSGLLWMALVIGVACVGYAVKGWKTALITGALVLVLALYGGPAKEAMNSVADTLFGTHKRLKISGLPWVGVTAVAFLLGYFLKGWKLALLSAGTMFYVAVFGMWEYTMETMALLLAAVPISIIIGLILGILAYRRKSVERALLPLMNVAQTLPHFAYLVPVVVFFGIGYQTGVIATIIFAVPPMVRLTMLGLQKVPSEIVDAGRMSGCTRMQLLFRVQLPTARNEIMLGVNQVIMQCLAMVVIAAFIGASGLGYRLLFKLQSLKLGQSFEIGVAIVLLAIVLDRLSYAWAEKKRDYTADLPFYQRYRFGLFVIGAVIISFLLAKLWPSLAEMPKAGTVTYYKSWDAFVDFFVIYFDAPLDTFKGFMVVYVLTPLRDALLYMPYIAVMIFIGGLGLVLGGLYSAALTVSFFIFIALAGWWDRAMITAYMVLFAVLICVVIGVPLGVWASRNEKRAARVLTWCDTFQTFPSFIYLLPVIMLFQVNDLSAIVSVIVYAMIPAIRYTVEGLKNVPAELHEAVTMAGCSRRQRLVQLELPVAMPHIMLGVNQTTMFAFSMVIIAAFIGTIDLGQSIFKALSETNVGKGLVLGLCVSFMALSVDHLITRWAREKRALLGLD